MYNMESVYNPRTKDHIVTVTKDGELAGMAEYRVPLKTVVVNQYVQDMPFFEVMKQFDKDDYEDVAFIKRTMFKRKELGL